MQVKINQTCSHFFSGSKYASSALAFSAHVPSRRILSSSGAPVANAVPAVASCSVDCHGALAPARISAAKRAPAACEPPIEQRCSGGDDKGDANVDSEADNNVNDLKDDEKSNKEGVADDDEADTEAVDIVEALACDETEHSAACRV